MLYLVTPHNDRVRALIASGAVGTFVTPKSGSRPVGSEAWAGDNGAYNGFDSSRFQVLLDRFADRTGTCLFIAAPDVIADWPATLDAYSRWSRRIAAYGYPVALVAQDGARPDDFPWDELDAVFVGGTTEWKLSRDAAAIVDRAKRLAKHAHMGRVNSYKRLAYAREIGCDTADGTFLKYAPDHNLKRLERWLERMGGDEQLTIPSAAN